MLDGCLKSIHESTEGIDFEVIVVDNCSSDGSAEMVRAKHPGVKLIQNVENAGFSKANNQAFAACDGRYFLLLNPDTVTLCGALPRLVEFLEGDREAGAVGPLVLNDDRSLQYSWAKFPTFWSEAVGKLDRRIDGLAITPATADDVRTLEPFRTDWVGGCCLMIRREAVQQIGLMDESLFMYSEETDWCLRLKKAGWTVWVEPKAEILHYGGRSSDQDPVKTRRLLAASKIGYFRKHSGPAGGAAVYAALMLRSCLRAIRTACCSR